MKFLFSTTSLFHCDQSVRRAGFTLTELLAVVLIITLIAGAGGGIYMAGYQKRQIESAARQLLLAAKYARVLAVDYQTQCTLHFDMAEQRFFLSVTEVNDETGAFEQRIIQNQYAKPVTLEPPIRFEVTEMNINDTEPSPPVSENKQIVFYPDGRAQATMIRIGDERNTYTAVVSAATGRMTLYEGNTEPEKETIDLDL